MDRFQDPAELVELLGDWASARGPLYRKLSGALSRAMHAGDLRPNGVNSAYTYNSTNRLTNLMQTKGGALASYAYVLDPTVGAAFSAAWVAAVSRLSVVVIGGPPRRC